ncbi:MAG TPA: RnfH family protein [Rubrivivax sp.]|nr:RnfH family protein [Pseudomonadota bacterium]HOL37009.1 RnfH family protein [Rubrivivax sp.]HPP83120.1 RnfH family protein [Rubrivivax sp.]
MRAERLAVEVVHCARPGQVDLVVVELPGGATLLDALRASGVLQRHGLPEAGLRAGVWSRERPLDTLLRDGDRVEVYRALQVDPKEARRQRQTRQREGAAAPRSEVRARRAASGSRMR